MSLQVEIAVAKAPKYAVRESGDSVEVVERPWGGISVVIADGQRSGRSAKAISNIAVRKAVSLLAEGVRDGAAARAAHDYLRTQRNGQVSAELAIVSVDLETRTLVISRNSRCPVLLGDGTDWRLLADLSDALGIHARARPVITELPLAAGLTVVAFTDGVLHAGSRRGRSLDPMATVRELAGGEACTARELADGLLAEVLLLDEGRPVDDASIAVLVVSEADTEGAPDVRRMHVAFPIPLS